MDQSPEGNRHRQEIDEGTEALICPGPLLSDECTKVHRIRIGECTGKLLSGYNTPAIVEDLRRLFTEAQSADTIVARSEDREVRCCVVGQSEVVYLKRYHVTGLEPFLRTVLRVNKAQKAWRIGRWLCRRGINTPLPIALFKCHPFSLSSEFVCITKGLTDAVDLYSAVLQVKGKHPNQQKPAAAFCPEKYPAVFRSDRW